MLVVTRMVGEQCSPWDAGSCHLTSNDSNIAQIQISAMEEVSGRSLKVHAVVLPIGFQASQGDVL